MFLTNVVIKGAIGLGDVSSIGAGIGVLRWREEDVYMEAIEAEKIDFESFENHVH